MKALLVVLLVSASLCGACAHEVTGAEIVEFGVFQKVASGGLLDAPKSWDSEANGVIEAKLVRSTTHIKAAVGTSFGIRVNLTGEPKDAVVTCGFRWLHPKMTDVPSGLSGEIDEWESQRRIGDPRYTGYTFDHQWELVPGKWTIQVLLGRKILAEKTFNVTVPPASNQAVQRTAGRSAFQLRVASNFTQQPRALSPAVADLLSR
jgi:hypothetical protein